MGASGYVPGCFCHSVGLLRLIARWQAPFQRSSSRENRGRKIWRLRRRPWARSACQARSWLTRHIAVIAPQDVGNGPNTVSESTFQTPSSVSFLALVEFRGENSVSWTQPAICVPKRTHRASRGTHRVLPQNSVVLSAETVLSKQYSARFLKYYRSDIYLEWISSDERPRAHLIRTHRKADSRWVQLFFPSPHEAAVFPSASLARDMFPPFEWALLLECLILMVASAMKNPTMIVVALLYWRALSERALRLGCFFFYKSYT